MEPDQRLIELVAHPTDEQFRLLVSSVTDYAIFLLDRAGRVKSWNAGAERMKGYRADEIVGRHFSLFYPPEPRAAGKPQEALRIAEQAGRWSEEGWRLRKDGTRFWAEVVITALRDDAGSLRGFAKVTRDMTDRRAAEEELRQSEDKLRAFTGHSPAVMFLKDREGRYRFVNEQFLESFGLRRDQVIGKSDTELLPPGQMLAFTANDDQVVARGEPIQFEETTRYVEGERVSVVVKFPVFDAAGAIAGIGGVATDITERKLAEQALRVSRALLADAQKLAELGCWEWDPASGRIIWSDELYRIYGADPQTFRPSFEGYLARVHPDDRHQAAATMARALAEGGSFTVEERIVRPDGGVRHLRSLGEAVFDERGKPVRLFGACLDITEQKHAEAALRAAADNLLGLTRRLVQAEEAERRRLARELHDRVGQSLSALNINFGLLRKVLRSPSPAVKRRLDDSRALVENTLRSIEDVMAELRPPLLDEYGLGAALAAYAEDFSRRTGVGASVKESSPEITRQLPPEAAVALFRIAQEALNNVVKHSRANKVHIAITREKDGVLLSILDHGRGFDPDAPSRRWGMTTMRERAEAAGGRLDVESAPGKGTAVRVRVPI